MNPAIGLAQEVPAESSSRDGRGSEARITRAVAALSDDYARQGGTLHRRQVDRYFDRRRLEPHECVDVLQTLDRAGITVTEDTRAEERQKLSATESLSQVPAPPRRARADDSLALLRHPLVRQLLTPAEEVELGRAIALGKRADEASLTHDSQDASTRDMIERGRMARERMIVSNLLLVRDIAFRCRAMTELSDEDLFQEGICGLMRAVERFDHERGFRFSTYATWWIRQAITHAIADRGRLVRFPVYVLERVHKLRRALRILTRVNDGRPPSRKRLCDELGWPPEDLQFLLDLSRYVPVSTETPLAGTEDFLVGDTLVCEEPGPAELAEIEDFAAAVRRGLEDLVPRERDIIERRFGIGDDRDMTLEEVGKRHGVTRERIRQLEAKALRKLRHPRRAAYYEELQPRPEPAPEAVEGIDVAVSDPSEESRP